MYKVVLSFRIGSFKNANEALCFALDNLHFKPETIYSQKSFTGGYNDFDKEKTLENFSLNNDSTFRIADDVYFYADELNDLLYREDKGYDVQYFIFDFPSLNKYWLDNLIKKAHEKGFFFGYYVNTFNALWQSEKFLDHYVQNNRPYKHLELKMHWHPIWSTIVNKEVIDIFQNPGHEVMTYNTWIMAAPEMWFGKDAFGFFNKENLLTYKAGIYVEELQNDLVYIKLFNADESDYETKEILALQADFREKSGMNLVEKKLDALADEIRKK